MGPKRDARKKPDSLPLGGETSYRYACMEGFCAGINRRKILLHNDLNLFTWMRIMQRYAAKSLVV